MKDDTQAGDSPDYGRNRLFQPIAFAQGRIGKTQFINELCLDAVKQGKTVLMIGRNGVERWLRPEEQNP